LVAIAISLMTVRRLESLLRLVTGQSSSAPDVIFEVVGLVISSAMAAGMYLIQPLFKGTASSREKLMDTNGYMIRSVRREEEPHH